MSRLYAIPRLRWAYRQMIIRRWHVAFGQPLPPGARLCTVDTEEGELELRFDPIDWEDAHCLHLYVGEGDWVRPNGELIEWAAAYRPTTRARIEKRTMVPLSRSFQPRPLMICYRRDDSAAFAGRLFDNLDRAFPGQVFMDLFGIPPGQDWLGTVQTSAASCSVLVVVIGRDWLTVTDTYGHKRLFSETDTVRREIVSALDRGITIVPVLVDGAQVPRESGDVPSDMSGLSQFQGLELLAQYWSNGIDKLVDSIRNHLPGTE